MGAFWKPARMIAVGVQNSERGGDGDFTMDIAWKNRTITP